MFGDGDKTAFCGIGLIATEGPTSEGNPFGHVMTAQDFIESYSKLRKSAYFGDKREPDSLYSILMQSYNEKQLKDDCANKNYTCCQLFLQGSKVTVQPTSHLLIMSNRLLTNYFQFASQ
jgi:hypothetical protein